METICSGYPPPTYYGGYSLDRASNCRYPVSGAYTPPVDNWPKTMLYLLKCLQDWAQKENNFSCTWYSVECNTSFSSSVWNKPSFRRTLWNKFACLLLLLSSIPFKRFYALHVQCDQKKIAKCLEKLPKSDFTRKMNDFDTFTKIA